MRISSINLAWFAVLQGLGQTALIICLPAMATNTALNPAMLGLLMAVGGLVFVFGNLLWNRVGDRFTRTHLLRIGCFGHGVSHLIMALVLLNASRLDEFTVFSSLLAARCLYGLTVSAIYPTLQAMVLAQNHTNSTHQALVRLAAAINIGRLAGLALSALFLLIGDFAVMLMLSSLGFGLWIASFGLRTSAVTKAVSTPILATTALHWRLYSVALLVTTCLGAMQYGLAFLLAHYLESDARAGSAAAATLIGAGLLILLFQLKLFQRINRPWLTQVPVALLVLVFASLSLLLDNLMSTVGATLAMAVAAASLAPCYQSLAMQRQASVRTASGFSVAHALGNSCGAFLGGWLLWLWPSALFVAMSVLAAVAAILLLPIIFNYRDGQRSHRVLKTL